MAYADRLLSPLLTLFCSERKPALSVAEIGQPVAARTSSSTCSASASSLTVRMAMRMCNTGVNRHQCRKGAAFLCPLGKGSRAERLRALRDQRKTREQPLVERRERQRLTIRELNEQGVVGGDSGLQGAPERPAPQRSTRDRMDPELACIVELRGRIFRRDDARASSHPDDVRELRLPQSRREGIDHAAPEVFRLRREPRRTEQVVCNDVGIDDRPHSRPPVIQASISFDSGRRDCRAQDASICLRTESRSATCCSRMSLTCCSMDLFCRLARRFKLFTTRAGTSLIVKVAPRALMLAVC